MKPTPTDTHCPPPSELRRLLQRNLPEAESVRLREHIRDCAACQVMWRILQEETVATSTPPVLHPADDTLANPPAQPAPTSPIDWFSGTMMEGPGGNRPASSPSASRTPSFAFLSPPREAGELGWL